MLHPKIKEWFNTNGRTLASLKLIGCSSDYKPQEGDKKNEFTQDDWASFLILTGQLDALIWIFCPEDPDEALCFVSEINNLVDDFEEEAILTYAITGMKNAPKGEA